MAKNGLFSVPITVLPSQYCGLSIQYSQGCFCPIDESVLKLSCEARVVHTVLSESWLVHTAVRPWKRSSVVGTWSGMLTGSNVLSVCVADQVPYLGR